MRSALARTFVLAAVMPLVGVPVWAATIVVDYSLDTTGIFTATPTAKAALDQAAADLSAAIISTPGAVTDTVTGTSGSASATYNFSWSYTHPVTGVTQAVTNAALASGSITVYAGWRNLTGTTLGQGGPGGAGFGGSGSGSGVDFTNAVNNANALGTANMGRGSGPVIGTLTGNFSGNPIAVDFGVGYGNIWFDSDTNNDSTTDSAGTLASSWHFDHTTGVAGGKSDLYSVALHELLHGLGIGTGDSWDNFVSGTSWTGPAAIAEYGTGTGLIDVGGAHIASSISSTVYGGILGGTAGASQEVVMDPSITVGTRKYLTELDLAFMQDVGWQVVPEPSTVVLLGAGGAVVAACVYRRHRRGS